MEPEGSLPHSQEPATCPYPLNTSLRTKHLASYNSDLAPIFSLFATTMSHN
jgi:hypothetical protein